MIFTPRREPIAIALHRLVAGRPWTAPTAALASAAHRGEVAVLVSGMAPELAPSLADIALRQRRFDALLELALSELAPRLVDLAPMALLKGSAAAAWAYTETAQRMRRDIDLLVGDALPIVRATMLASGWRDSSAHEPTPNERAWPMLRELGAITVSVDLHRRLTHRRGPDIAAILADRVSGRAQIAVTSVPDTFVNTALHLVGTGFHEPLKGWVDLLRLLPLVSPKVLASRARLHHARTAVWTCLGVVQRWFDADASAHRAAIQAPPHARLIDALLAGEHQTPERVPIARGVSYRAWRLLLRDHA